ncbi:MAG: hypothetical protein ACOYB1_18575 [Limnohabitans sp.]
MDDYRVIAAIISGAVGLITGFLGALAKPLIDWDIEKRRLRRTERIEKIKLWRKEIEAHTDFHEFVDTATFNELRHRFSKEQLENFSAKWQSKYGPKTDQWERGKFLAVHSVVDAIEKEWKII